MELNCLEQVVALNVLEIAVGAYLELVASSIVADDDTMLVLLEGVKGKFMLTMFPYEPIERFAEKNGWIIHRIERTISASKTARRKQEEWMVCNYPNPQQTLFDIPMGGGTYIE